MSSCVNFLCRVRQVCDLRAPKRTKVHKLGRINRKDGGLFARAFLILKKNKNRNPFQPSSCVNFLCRVRQVCDLRAPKYTEVHKLGRINRKDGGLFARAFLILKKTKTGTQNKLSSCVNFLCRVRQVCDLRAPKRTKVRELG